jgi:benzoyl-CoA-dihydrodiol lyase
MIEFATHPDRYRHWKLTIEGRVATLAMAVDEGGGLDPGYQLKLNSYDLGVDIELYDAVQRLRFEHPDVGSVILTSGKERIFCAGANIAMLATASHAQKVNFCKFTNETRFGIEDATANSGQRWLCAINGPAAGGGYELALACDYLMLVDDGSATVALPEVPSLAVLPGTGGLTRLIDKRKVRRDRADAFCTLAGGLRGRRALEWGLVDELVPRASWDAVVAARAAEAAAGSPRPGASDVALRLTPLERTVSGEAVSYRHVRAKLDRGRRTATITVQGPDAADVGAPADGAWWPLAVCRELDDVILHLRTNEPEIGVWVLRTEGDPDAMAALDARLLSNGADRLVHEIILFWKRTLKRLDVTSRSLIAVIEPGSCFTGTLLELALASDQSYHLDDGGKTAIAVTEMNLGPLPMANGLTRLATRGATGGPAGQPMAAAAALAAGLVTFSPDDLDWEDEVRLAIEQRASFSPDALTGMEANLRFAGPETMETRVFGRLTAWQNWIFQRPNAVGERGALRSYGSGVRPDYDPARA